MKMRPITKVEQVCLDFVLPPGVTCTVSGDCDLVERDGKTTLVAPFGAMIYNFTGLPSPLGRVSAFHPCWEETLRLDIGEK